MMMIIRTRTELAPMMTFLLLFWIILVTVSVVDGEGGEGLTPEGSPGDSVLKFVVRLWTLPSIAG